MSARLHLDFLNPAPPRPRLTLALVAVAMLFVLGCLWASVHEAGESGRLAAVIDTSRRASLRETPARRPVVAVDAKRIVQDVAEANEVNAHLATPWASLFAGIEKAVDPTVVLTGLQPEAQGRRIRISGVARRYPDVLAYVDRLQDTHGLLDVFLASHEAREDASGVTIAFTLTADWQDAP